MPEQTGELVIQVNKVCCDALYESVGETIQMFEGNYVIGALKADNGSDYDIITLKFCPFCGSSLTNTQL
jgi:hypothetical protein